MEQDKQKELVDMFCKARLKLYEEQDMAMDKYGVVRDTLVEYMKVGDLKEIKINDTEYLRLTDNGFIQWRKTREYGTGPVISKFDQVIAERERQKAE